LLLSPSQDRFPVVQLKQLSKFGSEEGRGSENSTDFGIVQSETAGSAVEAEVVTGACARSGSNFGVAGRGSAVDRTRAGSHIKFGNA
jgi:hypothetical protein